MKRIPLLRTAAAAALALATTAAHAASFDLIYAGSFDSATTLGGAALGADTPFSIRATFDSSVKEHDYGHTAIYPITALTLTLNGSTYISDDNGRHSVKLQDVASGALLAALDYGPNSITYDVLQAGFSIQSNANFDVSAGMLSANTYSSPFAYSASGFKLVLVGVSGGLWVNNLGSAALTASVAPTPVPEPSGYAAVVGLALGVFALVHHRRQAASR